MIGELMAECKNYFEDECIEGTFSIDNCTITPSSYFEGSAYIAIVGSTAHDGVYHCVDGVLDGLQNDDFVDTFNGRVYFLHPPSAFVKLAEEVENFSAKAPVTAVVSETFGAYSHTNATGSCGVVTWQEAFARKMLPYRRMYTEVRL